jgi:homogentisate 1,2-dioxygenase
MRGSFQKFCTLYVFSLKINLFYKIHLQAFNVIFTALYHSGPTFGQVLYSCPDAFVVDASDYSVRLIRYLLNASEAFSTEWFLRNKSKSGGLSPPDFVTCSQN